MKPISAQHKYALRYEMTTDALNFRELAFRQTSSRRPPRSLQSPASHLHSLAPSRGWQWPSPGGRGPRSRVRAALRAPERPLVRPLRSGQTLRGGALPSPTPAGRRPGRHAAPPSARGPSVNKLRAQGSEKREGAGRLPARTPESREERESPGTRLHSHLAFRPRHPASSDPAAPGRPGPAHTGTRLHTRAHTQARTRMCAHTGTPARAHARTHSG